MQDEGYFFDTDHLWCICTHFCIYCVYRFQIQNNKMKAFITFLQVMETALTDFLKIHLHHYVRISPISSAKTLIICQATILFDDKSVSRCLTVRSTTAFILNIENSRKP